MEGPHLSVPAAKVTCLIYGEIQLGREVVLSRAKLPGVRGLALLPILRQSNEPELSAAGC